MSTLRRHIQDYSNASSLEPHWGYADRVVPCTNDPGSCAYLDEVYGAHDRGMIYAGAMWLTICTVVLAMAIGARTRLWQKNRLVRSLVARARRFGLPSSRFLAASRVQVAVLVAGLVYLTIFSFVGLKYAHWVTPVKNTSLTNYRSSIGTFADRLGILAYALTPLSILLASRESLLSAATGLPHTAFVFLHRWTGHVILAQAVVHTIGWCVVELRLYQPQPSTGIAWIKQTYMVWGVVALILLLLLWLLATPWARRILGYEAFRKAHYVLAMLFVGACWGHWAQLKCFLLPTLLFWGMDRGARLARTALIHHRLLPSGGAFTTIPATITHFGDAVRLDLPDTAHLTFAVGQHYYLTFPKLSLWQSHPFTPLSLPGRPHAYIIRAKRGETRSLASLDAAATPTVVCGAYGVDVLAPLRPATNILAIAGGTGISFVLPAVLRVAQLVRAGRATGRVDLVWAVRHTRDLQWIAPEVAELCALARAGGGGVDVRVHVTRATGCRCEEAVECAAGEIEAKIGDAAVEPEIEEAEAAAEAEVGSLMDEAEDGRPDVAAIVQRFVSRAAGPTTVFASGPCGMVTEVRAAVARANDGGKVWKGEEERDVALVVDHRFE